MSKIPTVTVLIPARNEEADIERCLRAVLAQDHPHELMEVVLVDGGSADRTVAIADSVLGEGDIDWKLVRNPVGTTPSNLNAGLAIATSDILCRVDARSIIPANYVRLCADVLGGRPEVAVTGGAQVAIALGGSAIALGIARALNNKYAMGGSRYRAGAPSGPSDTVYLGAFRTAELREATGWNDHFWTNQDYELNRRMGRRGLVWFDNRLAVGYVPRQSLRALWLQYHRFGRWKVRYWRRTEDRPQRRQLGPIIAVPIALAIGYLLLRAKQPNVLVGAAMAGGAAATLLDTVGGTTQRQGLRVRVVAATTSVLVITAWTTGVWRELIVGVLGDG